MKRSALFPLMLGVSVCFHAGLGFFLSVSSPGAPGLPVPKDQERPLSLVNIALLEPAVPEPRSPQSSPRPAEPVPVQDPLPVEHYTTTEEGIDQPRDEPALQGDGAHAESGASTGTAEQATSRRTEETARQSAEYMRRNYNYLQRRIRDKLVYPAPARRAGIQGVAEVTFTIHEDGKVSDVTIRKSSGHAVLDDAAIQTIIAAAPFPKPPAPARIAIPISFRLR